MHSSPGNKTIVCYFNHYGYKIESLETGDILYESGNHNMNDFVTVPLDHISALPLEKIMVYGSQTAIQIANELELEYAGAEFEPVYSEEDEMENFNINELYIEDKSPKFFIVTATEENIKCYPHSCS